MKVLGLMSGTSFDGIDVALLDVEDTDSSFPGWELVAFRTRPFRAEERRTISETLGSGGAKELALLHTALGEWFSTAALELLAEVGLGPKDVVALGFPWPDSLARTPPGGAPRHLPATRVPGHHRREDGHRRYQ